MAFSLKLFVMISLATWTLAARPVSSTTSTTLATRLRLDDNNNNKCWETLFELQHCMGEVVLFFLNGETYLGSGCCHALLTIAHQCWPDMLNTLGLTPQEADILRHYCDGTPPSHPRILKLQIEQFLRTLIPFQVYLTKLDISNSTIKIQEQVMQSIYKANSVHFQVHHKASELQGLSGSMDQFSESKDQGLIRSTGEVPLHNG
ncbi:Prolamin-like domain [Sesbania bispinosa]|nr:Prolamin-like domain [Sesbania bispinosa]